MKIRIDVKHLKECKYCGEEDLSWYDLDNSHQFKLYKCAEGEGHAFVDGGEITHILLDTEELHRCQGRRGGSPQVVSGEKKGDGSIHDTTMAEAWKKSTSKLEQRNMESDTARMDWNESVDNTDNDNIEAANNHED